MFSANHFIWLGIIGLLIAAALFAIKKTKASHSAVGRVVMIALILLKLFHMSLSMKESEFGGYVINQTQLSFHLCSIMIYFVIFSNIIKNKKVVDTMKSFMVPCLFIGAAMALLIPTEGVDPTVPRVWQYMLIHGMLVFYGIYLATVERVDLSFKAYLNNLKLLSCVALVASLMNSVLEQYDTNFLFLRVPQMEGLPLLNLNNGWYVYFLTLTLVACALMLLVQAGEFQRPGVAAAHLSVVGMDIHRHIIARQQVCQAGEVVIVAVGQQHILQLTAAALHRPSNALPLVTGIHHGADFGALVTQQIAVGHQLTHRNGLDLHRASPLTPTGRCPPPASQGRH